MTVRQRKWKNKDGTASSCWMVDITYDHPNGKVERIRKTAPGTTKREAEAYERQIISSLINGTYSTHKEVPLYKDFYELWERDYCNVHMRFATQERSKQTSKAHLLPTYGHLRLDEITAKDVAALQARLLNEGERKPSTVNLMISTFISQINVAVKWGLTDKAPSVMRLKVSPKEVAFFDFDEADRLIKAAEDEPELQAMVILALKTGMRAGELLALRWSDVDLIKQVLTVKQNIYNGVLNKTPKGGKAREIPLSDQVVNTLKEQRLRSALRGEYVFSCSDGTPIHYRNEMGHLLPRLCRKAGLRELRWHTLRHTFASHLVMLNVPLKVVQELLGHSKMDMTMRYAHLAPSALSGSIQLLDSREVFGTATAQKEIAKNIKLVKS
jgi:integrase